MVGIINSLLQALWEPSTRPVRLGLPTPQAPAPARSAVGSSIPEIPPPAYQQVESSDMWCLWIEFTSDRSKIPQPHKKIDSSCGWFAELVLWVPDIVGLMRDGLYVTEEDVDISKNTPLRNIVLGTREEWFFAIIVLRARSGLDISL